MKYDIQLLNGLLNLNNLYNMTSLEIIEDISMNIYDENNLHLWDKEVFAKLPEIIQHCLVLINFDTEVSINGIFGFLKNNSRLYIDETILTFEKIKANENFTTLNTINNILMENKISLNKFENDIIHEELAHMIESYANHLYLYTYNEDVFKLLELYMDENRASFLKSII